MDLEQLKHKASLIIRQVADDPEARYALRQEFYRRYGILAQEDFGFGNSELAFLRWEINRGVLNPLSDTTQKGSPWWRGVNAQLIYFSTLGQLIYESGQYFEGLDAPVLRWLMYLQAPTPISWYQAHNASIISGYLDHVDEALAENVNEQLFLNVVLYRLLYAQALVEGVEFGELGRVVADPRFSSVHTLLELPAFYPDHYPLDKNDIMNIMDLGHDIEDFSARILDRYFIIPQLDQLYAHAARWNGVSEVITLVKQGTPAYPVLIKLSDKQRYINWFVRALRLFIHLFINSRKVYQKKIL